MRFIEFKGSVRCNFHRETRENREQKRECPQEDRRFSRGVVKTFKRAKKFQGVDGSGVHTLEAEERVGCDTGDDLLGGFVPYQVDDKHEDILHIRSYGEAKEDCLDDWDHEE